MKYNCIAYDLKQPFTLPVSDFNDRLAQRLLQPCGGLEMARTGFVTFEGSSAFAIEIERCVFFTVGQESRVLPASVIRKEVGLACQAWERERGFKPGRKVARDIKDRVITALIPKAFTHSSSFLCWIDRATHRLCMLTSSTSRADEGTALLREVLDGSLEITPIDPMPQTTMIRWIQAGAAEHPFTLGESLALYNAGHSASIRWTNHPLDDQRIKTLVDEGYGVKSLDVMLENGVSVKLQDKPVLKSIQLPVNEQEGPTEGDAESEYRATLLLVAHQIGTVLDALPREMPSQQGSQPALRDLAVEA